MGMGMLRSCTVSGRRPRPAKATGVNTGKSSTLNLPPSATTRRTLEPRRWPVLMKARRSSCSFALAPNTASTSSKSTVFWYCATDRKRAAMDTLNEKIGACTRSSSTSKSRVLPDCFSALITASRGVLSAASIVQVCSTHNATITR
jgi:hypothetical protein